MHTDKHSQSHKHINNDDENNTQHFLFKFHQLKPHQKWRHISNRWRLLRNQSKTFCSFLDNQSTFKLIFSRTWDTARTFSPPRFAWKKVFTCKENTPNINTGTIVSRPATRKHECQQWNWNHCSATINKRTKLDFNVFLVPPEMINIVNRMRRTMWTCHRNV